MEGGGREEGVGEHTVIFVTETYTPSFCFLFRRQTQQDSSDDKDENGNGSRGAAADDCKGKGSVSDLLLG